MSALVIGSLIPDYAYLPFMPVSRLQSHSFLGMFWFDLPMGLITFYLFHNFIKEPTLSLLPEKVTRKLPKASTNKVKILDATLLFSICASLWIGTATHIIWDSFTHEDGFMVTTFPVFQTRLLTIFSYDVIVYKILQHGSTLVGTLLLVYWVFQWFRKSKDQNSTSSLLSKRQKVSAIVAIFLITLVVSLVSGYLSSLGQSGLPAFQLFYKNMIIMAFTSTAALFGLYSCFYQIALKKQ